MKNILFITQNTENELLTHTISCVIMILRFVFVPVKQVRNFSFGEARKKKYEEHGFCLLWWIRSFRMNGSKWPFFCCENKYESIQGKEKNKNQKERGPETLVKMEERKW